MTLKQDKQLSLGRQVGKGISGIPWKSEELYSSVARACLLASINSETDLASRKIQADQIAVQMVKG